jgi:hypothetical protein
MTLEWAGERESSRSVPKIVQLRGGGESWELSW